MHTCRIKVFIYFDKGPFDFWTVAYIINDKVCLAELKYYWISAWKWNA